MQVQSSKKAAQAEAEAAADAAEAAGGGDNDVTAGYDTTSDPDLVF